MNRKMSLILAVAVVSVGVFAGYFLAHWDNGLPGKRNDHEPSSGSDDGRARTVILISVDTLRADHLSCYGYKGSQTPNIDALASEGTLFEHCYTPYPLTLPAHTSMLTGTSPVYHKVRDNTYSTVPRGIVTFAEAFRDGYGWDSPHAVTAGFVSSAVMGKASGIARGFDLYDDNVVRPQGGAAGVLLPERSADETLRLAGNWLESRPKDQPVFLFIHLMDPHFPYNPPDPKFRAGLKPWTEPTAEQLTPWYDAEVAYTDDRLGAFFQRVRDMGRWSKACVVLTADHGEGLGGHGELTHGYTIHDETTHVPLIIRQGDPPKFLLNMATDMWGVRESGVVSLMDVFPTMSDCAGLQLSDAAKKQQQGMNAFRGYFGRDAFNGREAYIESWYGYNNAGWAKLRGLRGVDHFSVVVDGAAEEYRDADCRVNLMADPAKADPHDQELWQESRDRVAKILSASGGAGIRAAPRGDRGAYYYDGDDHGTGAMPGSHRPYYYNEARPAGAAYPENKPDKPAANGTPAGTTPDGKPARDGGARSGYGAEFLDGGIATGEETLSDSAGRVSPHTKAAALAEYQKAEMRFTGGKYAQALGILKELLAREPDMLPAYKLAARANMKLAEFSRAEPEDSRKYVADAAKLLADASDAAAKLRLDAAALELRAGAMLYRVMLGDAAVTADIEAEVKKLNPALTASLKDRFTALRFMARYRGLGAGVTGDNPDAAAKLIERRAIVAKELEMALTHPDSCRELIADMRAGKPLKLAPWE